MSSTKISVAVAGVTNGLGNAIATALVANLSFTVILLTRPSSHSTIPVVLQPLVSQGAILRSADYTSIEAVTEALRGVHTVISTLFALGDSTHIDNLLKGAKAAGVKRFAPSEFAVAREDDSLVHIYSHKVTNWEDVKRSGMEYTAFSCGIFMDLFAAGSSYTGPLRMFPFVVDVKERKAEIPGTGNEKVTFTTVADIGKFVSAAVTLDKWPEEMGMAGETLSYNEVIRKAEEVTGEKFTVTYVTKEDVEKRRAEGIEKKDWLVQFHAEVFLLFIDGKGEIKDPYLNKATDVKTTKVTEFLQKYWST